MQRIQPEEGESAAIVSDNIERLKKLFPDAFSEGKLSFDVLRQLLGDAKVLDEGEEKYGLNWHGKKKARQIALTPSTGTLLPCPEESVAWDTTQNVFIEGDNLEVLKLLQKSYANKIKMIYIDPPYNTGKEFIYPDKFSDTLDTYLKYTGQKDAEGMKFSSNTEVGGRKHTNWLNMMYPRLRLARSLLRDNGVIFVSIDENEQANLKKICDEIFGEENFVANIIWQSRTSISNDQEVSLNHNHTLVYSKVRERLLFYGEPLKREEYSNPDNDSRGPWKLVPIDANKPGGDTLYPIINPHTGKEYYPPNGRSWSMNSKDYQKLFEDNRIKFGMSDDSAPKKKLFLRERELKGDTKTPSSLLLDAGTTKSGTTELMELFDGKKIFDYPKPSSFIERLVNYGCSKSDDNIVLDFFAGSCPTAHAVLNTVSNTGLRASFIMVQLPETVDESKPFGKAASSLGFATIAEIGKERIRRVAQKLKAEGKDSFDGGFKVFKLSSSNIRAWNPDNGDLEESLLSNQDHIIEGRSETDILYELLLKRGVDLAVPIERRNVGGKTVCSIGYGVLFACLDESIAKDQVEEVGRGIVEWCRELAPSTDSHVFFLDSAFSDDVSKTNMAAILEQNGITHFRSL
ncbi:MAG: site-specific DNA-methyltransferase [Thiogranum sp.]|nr:site-specific DNA-methyltransferase [Thiogranum sp.]